MKEYKEFYDLRLNLQTLSNATDLAQTRLTRGELIRQNMRFAGSGGTSRSNRSANFLPAYQDTVTGRVVLSCFADGRPAPIHILDGIPKDWVEQRGPQGKVLSVKENVVAGFFRDGLFYTREDVAEQLRH